MLYTNSDSSTQYPIWLKVGSGENWEVRLHQERKLKMVPGVFTNLSPFDFTADSDIDWTKSIAEIDLQLYKKYGLDEEEIAFIESMIRPME